MFTGIVEEKGTVQALQSSSAGSFIRIGAAKILEDIHIGDWTIVKKVDRELEGVKSFSRIGQAIKGYYTE